MSAMSRVCLAAHIAGGLAALGLSAHAAAQQALDPLGSGDAPARVPETPDLPPRLPAPPSLRVHVEGALTDLQANTTRWPDGTTSSPTCTGLVSCNLGLAAGLGLDWSSRGHVGFGVRARMHRHFAGDANDFGRRLYVLDLLSVPHVDLPWFSRRFPRGGARPYVALPVGLAWSFQTRAWSRAVHEDWNSRPGLSVGAALGLELFWSRRWGGLMELGYQARFMSADVISTPIDEPSARVSERVTTTQHQLLFSVGIVLGVRP
jgi:hypothetical protein